jgi:hypothetical protein
MATQRPETGLPLIEDDAARRPMAGVVPGMMSRLVAPSQSSLKENVDGSVIVDLDEEPDESEIQENADGSVLVLDPEDDGSKKRSQSFLENLAVDMEPAERARLGHQLLDDIQRDKEDRRERDDQYAEGIKRTGLGKEAPGGADFNGASKVVHPMLVEGCVDFSARVMKEVFPARGPVKAHIVGTSTREKIERAERKKKYMNWQCTKQMKEFRTNFEEMLTQVPLGGSQYIKVWHDDRFKRPRTEVVFIDKMHLPAASSSFCSAMRKTHEQNITSLEFESRVKSGLYRETPRAGTSGSTPQKSESELASEKIEGKSDSANNDDGLRTIYESYAQITIEDPLAEKDAPAPYIVTIDEMSGEVLAIYRNWSEEDQQREELEWFAEAKFFPWRGAYGIGLLHIAGSLSAGATGALRALLDSAHIANFPGALSLKGVRMSGQNTSVEPTQVTQIEGPTGVDDIRKLAMPFPFPGPSTVLFQLLEYMVQSGKGVIATAEEKIADASSTAPVGTTLAMIEQGSINYSSVHARMHATMEKILGILHRIDGAFMQDRVTVKELGELVVEREDFLGPMDVVPVSDPNIFSETQRFAQLQAVLQLRTQFAPGSFKDPALLEQAMRLLNYPNYEDVLNTPLEAEDRDAVEENAVAADPQSQLDVYENQDHLSHLETHVTFMASPIFCANPIMAPITLPKLFEHCKKHLIEYYRENVRAASVQLARNAGLLNGRAHTDAVYAAASRVADKQMAEELKDIMQALQQLQSQMAQLIPPPPDPEVNKENVKAQSQQAIEKMRTDAEGVREQQRLTAEQELEQLKLKIQEATEQRREMVEAQAAAAAQQAEATRHTEEMAVAQQNARMAELSEQQKQMREQFTAMMAEAAESRRNTQDNQTAVIVEHIKTLAASMAPKPGPEGETSEPSENVVDASKQLNELMVVALMDLMRQNSAPRSYRVNKNPTDGSMTLESIVQQGA